MPRRKSVVSWRAILFVVLTPAVVLGLLFLAAWLYGLVRYDPAYFTEPYLSRYETPGETARVLERALQTNDPLLLTELQGLRWPAKFVTAPSMIFVMLLDRTDRYITYLYFDMQTYERYPHYFEEVNGRWVVSPPDFYYYMRSGRWVVVFTPIAVVWWLLGGIALGIVVVMRVSDRFRAKLYGEPED